MERKENGTLRNGLVDPVDVQGMIAAGVAGYMPRAEAESTISTMQQDINTRVKTSSLAAVATSGNYSDLLSPPTIQAPGISSSDLSSALSGYVTTSALTSALATAGISVSRMTAVLGSGGTVTVAHGKTVVPVIVPVSRFNADQELIAVVGAITATQVTLTGKRTRGTLLLTNGPFEAAVSGDTVEVLVIGR